MKIAFSTDVYRALDLSHALEGLAREGVSAVEILADRPHAFPPDFTEQDVSALKARLNQLGLEAVNLDACRAGALGETSPHPSWIEEDWKRRENRIRYTIDCIRLAASLGLPHVTTIAAGPLPSTMTLFEGSRLFNANLLRVLPLARKARVKLLVQPEPGMLVESSDQMLSLIQEQEIPEAIGVDFNTGHFFRLGEDPCSAWEKLSRHVSHIHIEDVSGGDGRERVFPGTGAIGISSFVQCVMKSGYSGYATVSLDGGEEPRAALNDCLRYFRENGLLALDG